MAPGADDVDLREDALEGIPRPGDVIGGKFLVERVIGVGGMGVVLAARHLQLDALVAIKFMLPGQARGSAPARFLREARAAVRIRSEHVTRIIDVAELPTGLPYVVMEHLSGTDLGSLLAARGPLSVGEAADYVVQACDALAEAHSLGIVHRDLKPGNLFLTVTAEGAPLVKVLDFGIAKISDTMDASLTKSQALLGSPLYMSPEQLKSARTVDARTDVWALGVILHELLAGSPPFVADTLPEVVAHILSEEPPPLRTIRPDVPPALEALVRRCLERDLDRRTASVAELVAGLAPLAPEDAQPLVRRITRLASGAPRPVTIPPGVVPPVTGRSSASQPGLAPPARTGGGDAGPISTAPVRTFETTANPAGAAPAGAPYPGAIGVDQHAPGASPARSTWRYAIVGAAAFVVVACVAVVILLLSGGKNADEKRSAAAPGASAASDRGPGTGVVAPPPTAARPAPPATSAAPAATARGADPASPRPTTPDSSATQPPTAREHRSSAARAADHRVTPARPKSAEPPAKAPAAPKAPAPKKPSDPFGDWN